MKPQLLRAIESASRIVLPRWHFAKESGEGEIPDITPISLKAEIELKGEILACAPALEFIATCPFRPSVRSSVRPFDGR